MNPHIGGIHWLIGLKASRLWREAAAVPAISKGIIWPVPKQNKSNIPVIGFPLLAIQASSTANTGVVHGDDAKPKL